MPPEFIFPLPITDLWAPRVFDLSRYPREQGLLQVFGRLNDGVTVPQAQAEMNAIAGL